MLLLFPWDRLWGTMECFRHGHVVLYGPTLIYYSVLCTLHPTNQTEEKEKSSYFVIIKQDREKLESLFFFG